MAERGNTFWLPKESRVKRYEASWYKESVNKEDSENYSMGGDLDGNLEKIVGSHILLSGPLVDQFLQQIGLAMLEKLRRSHLTGLVPPIVIFMPLQIYNFFSSLCVGYGGEIKVTSKRTVIILENMSKVKQIFHPKRFDGTFFLSKRKFEKKINENQVQKMVYAGCAKVVVSEYTPIKIDYSQTSQKLTVSFFIQRYDSNDFAIDKSLQALMNQDQ